MNNETVEERTRRVIEGTRRPNFKHNGVYRVYGISDNPAKKTTENSGYNKTLLIAGVSRKFAQKIRDRESLNKKYLLVEVEEFKMNIEDITPEGKAITKEQFTAYEEVRAGGEFNMFSPDAIAMSGLDKENYLAIIKNYEWLEAKYGKET